MTIITVHLSPTMLRMPFILRHSALAPGVAGILGHIGQRALSAAVVERLKADHDDLEITYRDLVANPLPHMTLEIFNALDTGTELAEFLAADIVVIGAGFYNFSVPSQLKAWLDRIAVRGKTFGYGENGPVGLVSGKRVIVAVTSGNVYGEARAPVSLDTGATDQIGLFQERAWLAKCARGVQDHAHRRAR